jgi:ABC-type protease/lipase transport system fused ATPase/permease subunit
MTNRFYAIGMFVLTGSIFAMPDWDTMMKVYSLSVLAALTTVINILFQLQKIREWVVRMLTMDVIQRVFQNPDVNKLMKLLNNPDVHLTVRHGRKRKSVSL